MRKKMSEIKVDIIENTITVTKGYYKRAQDPNSREYEELQKILIANPTCKLVKREIKRNANKECYKGLDYNYMRHYILTHVSEEELEKAIADFDEMLNLSKCHSVRYARIKSWFLEEYPDVVKYGMKDREDKLEAYKPIVTKIFEERASVNSETEAA